MLADVDMRQAGGHAWCVSNEKAYCLLVVASNRDRVARIKVNTLEKPAPLVEVFCCIFERQ